MKRALFVILALVVVAVVAFFALAWRPSIEAIAAPAPSSFSPADVKRGEKLALIADCNRCHTAKGGAPYAGGFPLVTPFGTIYSTNITPDAETGIGKWSLAAFTRAMREGVDREGHHLYPAFPYDYFHLTSDEDLAAVYAFLMTRQPVHSEEHENDVPAWLAFRPILAGWKLLFLDKGQYQADSSKDETWNRGRYLADGLGHCGACHTPRSRFGASEKDHPFAGGEAEGWRAYALNADSPAPVKWTADSMFEYLRQGWEKDHGVAAGPMGPVAVNLSLAPENDVRAMANYVASIASQEGTAKQPNAASAGGDVQAAVPASGESPDAGAKIFASACAGCHEGGRPLPYGGIDLKLSTSVHSPDPRNFLHIVLQGIAPAEGARNGIMPAFGGALTDSQVAQLAAYVRSTYAGAQAWNNIEDSAGRMRHGEE